MKTKSRTHRKKWEIKAELNDFPRQRLVALAKDHEVSRRVLASHLLEWAVCQLDTGKLEIGKFSLEVVS